MGKDKTRIVQKGTVSGTLWLAGWLFTLGYLKLAFWKAVLAIVVWPYFLGSALAAAK